MVHVVHQYSQVIVSRDAHKYVARVYASQIQDGLWDGWFVFFPLHGGRALGTDRETTQSNLSAGGYWAPGNTPTNLEGGVGAAPRPPPEARAGPRGPAGPKEGEMG